MKWTEEEIQYLKDNYCKYGSTHCAKYLNRDRQVVWKKATYLGLKSQQFDLLGQSFGKLTVVENKGIKARVNGTAVRQWLCQCQCGEYIETHTGSLKCGKTKQCYKCSRKATNDGCYKGGKHLTSREFSIIRHNAKNRNLEFSISIKDVELTYIKQKFQCAYTGLFLCFNTRGNDKARILGDASVDRIDSSKGYTPDNIQIVHKTVNLMKQALTHEEFLDWCHKISDYQRLLHASS